MFVFTNLCNSIKVERLKGILRHILWLTLGPFFSSFQYHPPLMNHMTLFSQSRFLEPETDDRPQFWCRCCLDFSEIKLCLTLFVHRFTLILLWSDRCEKEPWKRQLWRSVYMLRTSLVESELC